MIPSINVSPATAGDIVFVPVRATLTGWYYTGRDSERLPAIILRDGAHTVSLLLHDGRAIHGFMRSSL